MGRTSRLTHRAAAGASDSWERRGGAEELGDVGASEGAFVRRTSPRARDLAAARASLSEDRGRGGERVGGGGERVDDGGDPFEDAAATLRRRAGGERS